MSKSKPKYSWLWIINKVNRNKEIGNSYLKAIACMDLLTKWLSWVCYELLLYNCGH